MFKLLLLGMRPVKNEAKQTIQRLSTEEIPLEIAIDPLTGATTLGIGMTMLGLHAQNQVQY